MNLPNMITILRVILSVFFMFALYGRGFWAKFAALLIFAVAALSDYADGFLARREKRVTVLGQFLDPIADKILVFCAFISYVDMGILPAWTVIMMLAREVLITGFRILAASRNVTMPAGRAGKNKAAFQMVMAIAVLLYLVWCETPYWSLSVADAALEVLRALMIIVVLVTLWTGIYYIIKHWKTVNFNGHQNRS